MPEPAGPAGELALVLHTHMPYVEGFGTWPFGEEWLWEAIAGSYLPVLDVLDAGAPVTLSLTPVLCDQLEAPGAMDRCLAFLRELRPETHRRDRRAALAAGEDAVAAELSRSAADYERAAERLGELGGDLLGALGRHAAWTSSASHAVLPLLATDAGVRLQVHTGVASQRRRFGAWAGGFWLPECAHAPWLDRLLEEAGVRATCVELTDVLGLGADAHLRPLRSPAGPLLCPVDRAVVDLVWGAGGYPSRPPYRDYHRHTAHRHRAWCNAGTPYDRPAALAQARADAADFVARVGERVAGGGLCVCALDTELLGHWWYEGPQWLAEVVAQARRRRLALAPLDEALARHPPTAAPELPVTSWGTPRDLSTWSAPAVAELAWRARRGELAVVAAGGTAGPGAVRELLALQASDWAFLVARDLAAPYGRERSRMHAARLEAALRGQGDAGSARGLAPGADPGLLDAP